MGISLKVVLPIDRTRLGTIQVVDLTTGLTIWGPKYCYGRADHGTAARNGNPGADQRRPYGNTPTGGYAITARRPVMPSEIAQYGAQDALRIDGATGYALERKANGTHDLLIHGGRPTLGMTFLRPTNGCLRLSDVEMTELLKTVDAAVVPLPIDLVVQNGDPSQLIAGGPDDGYDDPPTA